MTREECEKAHEDGTWLVWRTLTRSALPMELVRVVSKTRTMWLVVGTIRLATGKENDQWLTGAANLRIATPNDMLKYGE